MLPCANPLHNGGGYRQRRVYLYDLLSITEVTAKPLETGVRSTNMADIIPIYLKVL